jgi:hypothetical protein
VCATNTPLPLTVKIYLDPPYFYNSFPSIVLAIHFQCPKHASNNQSTLVILEYLFDLIIAFKLCHVSALSRPLKMFLAISFHTFLIASIFTSVALAQFNYNGGIPLRLPGTCPSGLVVGAVTFEQNCCAAGQSFVKPASTGLCCPDGEPIALIIKCRD